MWQREIRHDGLKTYRCIRGNDRRVVDQKAEAQLFAWEERWQRRLAAARKQEEQHAKRASLQSRQEQKAGKQALATERTQEARNAIAEVENVLAIALQAPLPPNCWEAIYDRTPFPTPVPPKPVPTRVQPKPDLSAPEYQPVLTPIDKLVPSFKRKKVASAEQRFAQDLQAWQLHQRETHDRYSAAVEEHKQAVQDWEAAREDYLATQAHTNAAIAERQRQYERKDPEAIKDYCDLILGSSSYPDYFPRDVKLEYRPDDRLLVVDYSMPAPSTLPRVKEVKYVSTRDEFTTVDLPASALRKMYDELLYRIALRSIFELFRADRVDALELVVFNGWVRSVDKSSGLEANACVLSVQASRSEFDQLNLAQVDAKSCFKRLKGVGSAALCELTPIRPILQLDTHDKRFVQARAVADEAEGSNLAAMDWEDFEHLIRELFEQEFMQNGGEVKITQASRDAGVDAVAFDPDPIRGGKIVIQAKRYTATVGLSAVRDLYGTVMNEGANKGILVTTADYGPDAYQFAKDKPLTLLNGSELLYLLQKHGHCARIDLREARTSLGLRSRQLDPN